MADKLGVTMVMAALRRLSRRQLLLGGAAGVAAINIGAAAAVVTRDPKELVIALIENALPGVTVDRPSAQVFAQDFMTEFYARFGEDAPPTELLLSAVKMHVTETVRGVVGAETIATTPPFEDGVREIVRRGVTRFLMSSNYFQVPDPFAEPIVYRARPSGTPCTNPFADLSPPKPEDVTPL